MPVVHRTDGILGPGTYGHQVAKHARKVESASLIDCGTPRSPQPGSIDKSEVVSERQWLERTKSYPPPPSTAALSPGTAVNDWRFGRISVQSVDPAAAGDVMPGEPPTSRAGRSAAPDLGPSFGGAGTATRAEFLSIETKNTELGWGVVHFYREGEETTSLNTGAEANGDTGGDTGTDPSSSLSASADDYSTLCIPAVPAYMSPSDFLGFIGERWRDDVSHCRMVMTSRMNRYLALLKFRDGKRAKKWKREFDGKVFNSMEVSDGSHDSTVAYFRTLMC